MTTFESQMNKRQKGHSVNDGMLVKLGESFASAGGNKALSDDGLPQTFQFSSSPRALYNNRKFKAGGDVPMPYSILMNERRLKKGSNFCPPPLQGEGESAAVRAAETRRRNLARQKAKQKIIIGASLRLHSPPPVKGRRHEPVQTELFLEEIFSHPDMYDKDTQTDLWLDRPVSPYYVPCKTGIDEATQIYPRDLFDFDMEVIPILEVLVGKTIEQSLLEVLEEEELAAIREQQRRFLEMRDTDIAEAQRLEERERRMQDEKNRRMKDYTEAMRITKEMEERIAASVLTMGYLGDLLPRVLEGLEEEGFLVDNVKEDVEQHFVPWLMKEVSGELHGMVSSRDVLANIVKDITENTADMYRSMYEYKPDEGEEGGLRGDLADKELAEHLKLKDEIMKD